MKKNGFTLIELLIAIGLSALFLPAIVFIFSFSLGAASQGENYTKAYTIATENMEAVYFLKENDTNWDWQINPVNTQTGEFYQPQKVSGSWILGSKTTSLIEKDGYTVAVQILPVRRDSNGNIVEGDETVNIDDYSRKIVVNVNWKENGIPTSIDLVSYVTKH